jgi:hypothetical protein
VTLDELWWFAPSGKSIFSTMSPTYWKHASIKRGRSILNVSCCVEKATGREGPYSVDEKWRRFLGRWRRLKEHIHVDALTAQCLVHEFCQRPQERWWQRWLGYIIDEPPRYLRK